MMDVKTVDVEGLRDVYKILGSEAAKDVLSKVSGEIGLSSNYKLDISEQLELVNWFAANMNYGNVDSVYFQDANGERVYYDITPDEARSRLKDAKGDSDISKDAIDDVLGSSSRLAHWVRFDLSKGQGRKLYNAVRDTDYVIVEGNRGYVLFTGLEEKNVAVAEKRILMELEEVAKKGYQNLN